MKIGVFAYNFEHKKTYEGLTNLYYAGIPVTCVFAADKVKLTFYESKLRISPKGLRYVHPQTICERLGIPYHIVVHNECADLVRKYDLDLGVILGARILKKPVIDAFKIGILNLHPGILPQNRGLDNIKWAVLKGYPQGATAHLINEKVDHGRIIMKQEVAVYQDDTLLDILLRVQSMEQELMVKAIRLLEKGCGFETVVSDESFKSVPWELEKDLEQRFVEYRKEFAGRGSF